MNDMRFQGFEPSNTTPVPDVLFDELLTILSGAQLKVMLYIIRRTCGFKKTADTISFNQFINGIITKDGRVLDKGCGVKDRTTLSKALVSLEEMNCIESNKSKNNKGENEITTYSIKFHSQGVVGKSYYPGREIILQVVGETYQGSMEIPQGVVGKSYPQETVIQQTDKQETVIQESNTLTHDQNILQFVKDADASFDMPTSSQSSFDGMKQDKTLSPIANTPQTKGSFDEGQKTMAISKDTNVNEANSGTSKPRTKKKVDLGPLVIPPDDAIWNNETAVQIVEFIKGQRYSPTTRSQELTEAKKVLDMNYHGALITREQFLASWHEMASWPWWEEKSIKAMIKHLRKDDKIVSILDKLQRQIGKNTPLRVVGSSDSKQRQVQPPTKVQAPELLEAARLAQERFIANQQQAVAK